MKGIILAGGLGTRLYPLTKNTSKQLLPVYDKPMIFYPLSTLMLAGIKDILIITTRRDIDSFKTLLGDGKELGINLNYEIQEHPNGLAEAFIIGEKFINNERVALILGDNIFYGNGMGELLKKAVNSKKSCIFSYYVNDPKRFGVVEFDNKYNAISIEEKPENPKSNYCVTGLYFYDEKVVEYAKSIKPSKRGELEITDLNNIYLKNNELEVIPMGRGYAWLDTGTFESLNDASNFIRLIQVRQDIIIAALEEIAYNKGFITKNDLIVQAEKYKGTEYYNHLQKVINDKIMY